MPLDPSIYGQIQQPQPINQLGQLAAISSIQGSQQQNRLQALQMQQLQQESADKQGVAAVYRNAVDPTTGQIDPLKVRTGLAQAGNVAGLQSFNKYDAEQNAAARTAKKAQLEEFSTKLALSAQLLGGVKDQASYDSARATASANGLDVSSMPAQYDPAVVQAKLQEGLTAAQQVDQHWKQMDYGLKTDTLKETTRHNQAGEGILVRGQNMVDSRSRESQSLQRDAARTQVVDTENGPVLVDKGTGQARPVTAPDGVSLRKPGKEVPAAANKSILENKQNIRNIDQAIAAIQARPNSLGPMNMVPGAETVRQYTDPEGVLARAGVSDVGSLILHDRSGASVTASETPRLRPFIPSASDRPEVAIEKLKRFRQVYEQEASLLADSYGSQQGYRNSTAAPASSAPNSDIDALLKKYGK